ncbi:hypothetical protein GCM10029964_055640 [Kibdelosporangium lantanae]
MTVTTLSGFAEVLSLNSATLPAVEGWLRGTESLLPPRADTNWRMNPVQRAVDHAGATGESMQDWMDMAADQCRELCRRSLAEAKLETGDVTRVVGFHLSRFAMEEQIAALLGVPLERTNWALGSHVGHIGPSDHVVSLERLLRAGELGPGDHVLLVSWGGGWNTTTAVLRILHVPEWTRASR